MPNLFYVSITSQWYSQDILVFGQRVMGPKYWHSVGHFGHSSLFRRTQPTWQVSWFHRLSKCFRIDSVATAIRKNASICVLKGAVVESVLKTRYSNLKLVGKETYAEIFAALNSQNNECDSAALEANDIRLNQHNKLFNGDCSLSSNERAQVRISAGMATAIDTGRFRCTSLINAVLDYHLQQMIYDGFVEEAWTRHLRRIATVKCEVPSGNVGSSFEETFSLGLNDVGGIFILHLILSSAAVILGLYRFYGAQSNRKKYILEADENETQQ